jgi:branched-chain amino acid transport system ATP-binding protein
MTAALMELDAVTAGYGRAPVLHGVSLAVDAGTIVALLGANGAGKTTTLRVLSGMLSRSSGQVLWRGTAVAGRSPSEMARREIAHVPEGRGTLLDLTVEENLRVGGYLRGGGRSATRAALEACYGYFPVLGERRAQRAAGLSGGEQQMLAVSRGLMMKPQMMLLDEPSLGLAPNLVRSLFKTLAVINAEQNIAMLIVEQNASLVLELASRAYVLESGRIVLDGASEAIRADDSLRRAYLGY